MTTSLSIRTYKASDHDDLAALYLEAFPHDPPWNEPKIMIAEKIAHQPQGLMVGIDANGILIASIKAGYDGHRGWINSLAVTPSARGNGLGKAMMDHAIAWLNDQGAVKVNLQIRGDNLALKAYYETLGFEEEHRISMGILTEKGKALSK